MSHQAAALRRTLFVGVFLCALCAETADSRPPTAESLCRDWFGESASIAPLTLTGTNVTFQEVSREGGICGWIFRTDQVPPACKGKRGEIVLLVGVGTDARIKGVRVVSHREDPTYFKRLTARFFDQFVNRRAEANTSGIDAVTRATFSSRAVIREVLEGAGNFISLPEVAAKIKPNPQSGLTKTAAMSHN